MNEKNQGKIGNEKEKEGRQFLDVNEINKEFTKTIINIRKASRIEL